MINFNFQKENTAIFINIANFYFLTIYLYLRDEFVIMSLGDINEHKALSI